MELLHLLKEILDERLPHHSISADDINTQVEMFRTLH